MTDSFENKLRRALKPSDPGEDFTQSVLARIPEATASTKPRQHRTALRGRWFAAALAASIATIAIVGVQVREAREREAGMHAREQLLEALKVTSEKLNLAYRVVHDRAQEPMSDMSDKSQSDDRKNEKSDRTGA